MLSKIPVESHGVKSEPYDALLGPKDALGPCAWRGMTRNSPTRGVGGGYGGHTAENGYSSNSHYDDLGL